jgi:hypothetical protein
MYSSDTDSSDGSSSDGSISDRSTDVSISNSVAAAPPVTPLFSPSRGILQGYKDEISSQKREIDALKKKIHLLQKKNAYHKRYSEKSCCHNSSDNRQSQKEQFKTAVSECINGFVGQHVHSRGAFVCHFLWEILDGALQPHFLTLARKHFRQNVFTPFNILKEMDLAGGTLSYEGIDVIRRVETSGLKWLYGCMIPSKTEIKRMAARVEWFGRGHCPFNLKRSVQGEAVEFEYGKAMVCITKAFQLDDIGKSRSLSVASSIDGASLSKNLSVVAGGVKVTDRAARCPLTSRLLLENPCTMSAQSRSLCIPFKILMGRETKESFGEFCSFFQFFDDLSQEGTIPELLQDFKPFNCMTNCDLSAQWKGLCKGGAAKVHTLPCTCCATESDELAKPNLRACTRWCHEHSLNPDWMCFHKSTATPELIESMHTDMEELISTL